MQVVRERTEERKGKYEGRNRKGRNLISRGKIIVEKSSLEVPSSNINFGWKTLQYVALVETSKSKSLRPTRGRGTTQPN